MKLEQARRLKSGDRVTCPPDRGEPGYIGTVDDETCATCTEQANHIGTAFIWVAVRDNRGCHIWPSNRLEVKP